MIHQQLVTGLRHDEAHCRQLEAALYPRRTEWPDLFAGPAERLPLDAVTDSNQVGISASALLDKLKRPDGRPLRVVRTGDRLTVWDGTHRFASARLRGESAVSAVIYDAAPCGTTAAEGGGKGGTR